MNPERTIIVIALAPTKLAVKGFSESVRVYKLNFSTLKFYMNSNASMSGKNLINPYFCSTVTSHYCCFIKIFA